MLALRAASGTRRAGCRPAGGGVFTGEGASTSSASGLAVLRYSSVIGLQVSALGTEDRLYAVAHNHYAGCTQRLGLFRVGQGYVLELYAQVRDAGVEAGDIAASAKRAHQLQREVVGAHAVDGLRSLVFDLTSRREQIETEMGNVKTPQYINAQTGPITQSHNAL
jgi:hypothetical protein